VEQRPAVAAGGETQIMLAEYTTLRAEIERRSNIQWNIFALQIGSAGAVTGLALSAAANLALLLIVPVVSYMLGNRYILVDYHVKLIRRYLSDSLSERLGSQLQWEDWRDREMASDVGRNRWFTATGWNVLHSTRLAFEGVAVLALAGALVASIHMLITRSPSWFVIAGFVVGWMLGAVATLFMHRTFERAG
jgi:hypothetical protein